MLRLCQNLVKITIRSGSILRIFTLEIKDRIKTLERIIILTRDLIKDSDKMSIVTEIEIGTTETENTTTETIGTETEIVTTGTVEENTTTSHLQENHTEIAITTEGKIAKITNRIREPGTTITAKDKGNQDERTAEIEVRDL